MGVVTGIVQEFQFGMNWSDYARFVGDIFGAPLAMEGLLSFFLESTFIGLWIFGWVRLSPRLRLVSIWLAATGTFISACFILAANSFVQNPVGYRFNPDTNRVELTDIWAVLTNKVTLVTFPHAIAATFLPGGGFVSVCRCVVVSLWRLVRHPNVDRDASRAAAKAGATIVLVASPSHAPYRDTCVCDVRYRLLRAHVASGADLVMSGLHRGELTLDDRAQAVGDFIIQRVLVDADSVVFALLGSVQDAVCILTGQHGLDRHPTSVSSRGN